MLTKLTAARISASSVVSQCARSTSVLRLSSSSHSSATPVVRSFAARAVHTPAAVPSIARPVTTSSSLSSTPSTSSQSSSSSSSDAAYVRMLTAGAIAGLVAYVAAQLASDEDAELHSSLLEKLNEFRQLCGLSIATVECEQQKVAQVIATKPVEKLNFESAKRAAADHPISPDLAPFASYWRRFGAFLIDNFLIYALDFAATTLIQRIVRTPVSGDQTAAGIAISTVTEIILSFVTAVAWEVVWMTLCNGQTPGKLAVKIRTIRLDHKPMDAPTAVKHGAVRAVLMPPMMIDIVAPLLFMKDAREQKQMLHNLWTNTVVVEDFKRKEDDE